MSYFVYIVKCIDDTMYTGIATDVEKRIAEHNSPDGKGAKYTRSRRPVKLVYAEAIATRSSAQSREYAIKQLSRAGKLALIKKSAPAKR
jgi:putative endonuclease